MKRIISAENLARFSGILLVLAGVIYILVQFIHPSETIEAVNTADWLWVGILSIIMSLFNVIGLLSAYVKQIEPSGLLGFIGFILLELFWLLSLVFGFVEAFVLPQLTAAYPEYVTGMIGLFSNVVSTVDLGIFPLLTSLAGVFYILGGISFGYATVRANVFPRFVGWLLAIASLLTIAASFVPHPADRFFAIPMGLALILLGYYVFKEPK